ncbi:unnamed protein product [Sphenostylis stenocarpa]|uniref:Uncharacterized protein n=1 Tax=Sphenostylis stenocarpa TaxID=92480 RepID=A0AA86W4K9_9FABA|nr:unnamed protein product [Sphenostylis stenocarpa]
MAVVVGTPPSAMVQWGHLLVHLYFGQFEKEAREPLHWEVSFCSECDMINVGQVKYICSPIINKARFIHRVPIGSELEWKGKMTMAIAKMNMDKFIRALMDLESQVIP